MKKNSKHKLILNIGLILVIFGILIYLLKNNLKDIIWQLIETPPLILLGVILLGTLYIVVEGENIRLMATSFVKEITVFDGAMAMCYSAFYRLITFGAGTMISEVNFYHKKGLRISQGVGVTALHLVMYKVALLTWAFISLLFQLFFSSTVPHLIGLILYGIVATLGVIVVLLALTLSLRVQVWFVKLSHRFLRSRKLRDGVDRINLQVYSLREAMDSILKERPLIFRIYLVNLFKLVFWFTIPYLVLVQNHPELNFFQCFGLICFSVILAGSIPTPAGIGSFEFVFLLLFRPLMGTVDAVSAMLLYRFASYMWPFIIGFVYFLFDKQQTIQTEIKEIKSENNESSEKG
ncbi:lysylphosphatidylglycerol synthase transmembrane domain-containing protein [Enterococcus asini]|uniref:lysylphosphatidylglycerol synthase transmembrane domain-containing protein n=1 Tax=Enterococcus asini TaxID=57732 RepID=UPI00288EB8A1|nr:lysylphosphatidylglycerol synthase transmembrane domain-containing protein [Enterococcus asini]MDT2756934.1 lysylphosphatidylglycerol synthase transmembrane domain-containing protein [Enterococcus asini]